MHVWGVMWIYVGVMMCMCVLVCWWVGDVDM